MQTYGNQAGKFQFLFLPHEGFISPDVVAVIFFCGAVAGFIEDRSRRYFCEKLLQDVSLEGNEEG